jgi:hypothetical protein
MLRQSFLVISFLIHTLAFAGECPLKDGDLIFTKGQSEQSRLLKITTGSDWTHVGMAFKRKNGWDVIEAVEPVKWTTLYTFIVRSKDLSYTVYRPTFVFDAKKVRSYAENKLGRSYDLVFAWNSDRWYCTELVWKAFKKASGEKLGELQTIGELDNIDSPIIMNEAKRRFKNYGLPYNHEEWKNEPVITPIGMMNASNLMKVDAPREDFTNCLKE